MTQFLSFQAQSTPPQSSQSPQSPQSIVSSAGGGGFFGNGVSASRASALDANAPSNAALNALANEETSFANVLNTQTLETAETPAAAETVQAATGILPQPGSQSGSEAGAEAELQSGFATFFNADAFTLSAEAPSSVPAHFESIDGSFDGDASFGLEGGEDVTLNLDGNGSQVESEGVLETENVSDGALLNNPAFISDAAPLGAVPTSLVGEQGISSEGSASEGSASEGSASEGSVRATFGAQPLSVQPSNIGDIDINDTGLGDAGLGTITPISAPIADPIAGGLDINNANLANLSAADAADAADAAEGPNFVLPAGLLPTEGATPSAAGVQGLASDANQGIVVPANLTGSSSILPAGVVANGDTAGFSSDGAGANINVENRGQQTFGNPLVLTSPVQPTNETAQLPANLLSNLAPTNSTPLNPLSVDEQNLLSLNSDQAEGVAQRGEQTLPRQAGVGASVLGQAEANPLNPNQGAAVPNGASANANQLNSNAVPIANGTQVNQPAVTPEGQDFNATANASGQASVSASGANDLSQINQIAQLLGQASGAGGAGGNEAQLAALQANTQPAIQLGANGPSANYTPQATAQLPAFFADETLPALSAQLSRGIVGGRDSFNIQLNPSELGRVDVRFFTNDDGSVNARVLVDRVETLDLFQRDLRALERSLLQSGIKLSQEGIDLSLKDNGANGGDNNAASNGEFTGNQDQRSGEDTQRLEEEGNRALNDRLLVEDIEANLPGDVIQTIYARFTPGQLNIEV